MKNIRSLFPIFKEYPNLVYLDSASTTQKPHSVIDAELAFYQKQNANVHRGIYPLAAKATQAYEATREKVKQFLNTPSVKEVIFTSGTTDSVNLVASTFALDRVGEGDEVVISAMEHHANLIPWQQVCLQKGGKLVVVPFDTEGVLSLADFEKAITDRTKLVAVTHVSNTLGTVNPIADMIKIAHSKNVPVFVDAAQSVASHVLDVQALDVDFLAFSGHKLFGPTGVGVLYGKEKWLNSMRPHRFGGEMIRDVTFKRTLFAPIPQKFEAGTPNIAGVVGLGAAIDFVESVGQTVIKKHVDELLKYATNALKNIEGLDIIGQAKEKSGIISFILRGAHPHDVATILGQQEVCIRAGHHCTQPIMDFYELPATVRVSLSVYNDFDDIDKLIKGLKKVQAIFA
ncbi:MAG: cysteine desulfurase [Saprospiraceae bacterium]|nr:cysteine desulfurase [Saprospiraceae bacterium]